MPLYVKIVMTLVFAWGFGLMASMVADMLPTCPLGLRRIAESYIIYGGLGGLLAIITWVTIEFLLVIWGVRSEGV